MRYARITHFYRAEIKIPEDVFQAFGHTSEYDMFSCKISGDYRVAASGQDAYSSVYEWAEDASLDRVEAWAVAWENYVAHLERRLRK